MAPFQYSPYTNPYVGTIAEAMMAGPQAQARAAEQSGQIWGSAVNQVGQSVAGTIQQATDPRVQLERQQLDANKRTLAFNDTVNKITSSLFSENPDGSRPIDLTKAKALFAQAKVPLSMQSAVLKELEGVNDSIAKFNTTRTDHVADLAHGALQSIQAGADPQTALAFGVAAGKANHLIDDAQVQPLLDAVHNGADVKTVLMQVRGLSEKYKDLSKPVPLPRQSPGILMPDGSIKAVPLPEETQPEANVVYKDAAGIEHPVVYNKTTKQYLYNGQDVSSAVTRPNATRSAADQALDAYATSLGKTKAEDLTDLERQAYDKREKKLASDVGFQQHQRERDYDIAHPVPEKTKSQDALEQEYRTVLARGLSSRSGGLGLEDSKVQQANHLLALLDQTYDAKSGQYTIPKVLQGELAAGLARLVAPGGNVGIEMMREFNQKTAKGDLADALSYITGSPWPTATQDIAKMLKDSIERQGKVAEQNREGEMGYLRGLAPTDLDEGRRTKLEATTLNALRQSRIIQNTKTGERRLQVSIDGGKTWK